MISKRLELRLASGESKWSLKGKYDEFWGKTRCTNRKGGVPDVEFEVGMGPVLMVMEEGRMKLRGENQGKGAPTGIEERISSRAAHQW